MIDKLTTLIRLLLGTVYFLNGLNWFFKIITPYPSFTDFIDFMPPPDIVGALIDHGIMFHLAKAVEVITGIALLANRFVPLSLVVSMTVTVPVFIVDVYKPEWRLRAFLMGSGSLVMNIYLLIAFYDHYRPMLTWKTPPTSNPAIANEVSGGDVAEITGKICAPLMWPLAIIGTAMGLIMVGWLLMMIGQYIADPKAIYEVREMIPR